jgi:uncharacterized membrane protein
MNFQDCLPLTGIVLVVLGFALGLNPLLVVLAAGLLTAWVVGMGLGQTLALVGEKFMSSRQLAVVVLVLPVIALLEHKGLKEHARRWVASIRGASAARVLMLYFLVRQAAAALGLTSLGGQAQTVRPLIAPMSEGLLQQARQAQSPAQPAPLGERLRDEVRAHAAACDNIALFFGEDIFMAFGAVLLMSSFLHEHGITHVEPLVLGLWALPTAVFALLIHQWRLSRLDARWLREPSPIVQPPAPQTRIQP